MKGFEALMRMRLDGSLPRSVNVDLGDYPTPDGGDHLTVADHESIHSLDFRPVNGLVVWVTGKNAQRVQRVAQACEEAGAKRVIGTTLGPKPNGRSEVVEMTDTDGVIVWKQ